MKYFIAFILLITILAYGQVMGTEYPLAINILLIVLIFTTSFLEDYELLNIEYESDFKIRSQTKKIRGFSLAIASYWTTLLILNDNYKNVIFIILIFWIDSIVEFIIYFIYNSKKPFTIFIKDNELILNKRWNPRRNITELTQIQFDRFNKNLKLDFKSKSGISIKTSEYKSEDIEKLLAILIEKSENNVTIPKNYEPKLKNSC